MVPECRPFLLGDQLLSLVVLLEHGVLPDELMVGGGGVSVALLAGARVALVLPGVSLSHDDVRDVKRKMAR